MDHDTQPMQYDDVQRLQAERQAYLQGVRAGRVTWFANGMLAGAIAVAAAVSAGIQVGWHLW